MILSFLVFLLIFSFLILVHEWGHFFAARRSGVKVLEFGLGMGKRIYGKKIKGTEYTLNAVPFGGFVRMLGEEESSDDPRSFERASLFRRMIIILAGVAMNFLSAILILTYLFTVGTTPILISKEDVLRAESQGLVQLDKPDAEGKRKVLSMKTIQKSLPEAFLFATQESGRISVAIVQKLGEIPGEVIRERRFPEGLSGPVGIAEATHKLLPFGINAILKLTAMLSISLAVFNVLPFPALDGGRFLFQMLELLIRRRPNPKWEQYIHFGGFVLLICLFVVITWNDLTHLFF